MGNGETKTAVSRGLAFLLEQLQDMVGDDHEDNV